MYALAAVSEESSKLAEVTRELIEKQGVSDFSLPDRIRTSWRAWLNGLKPDFRDTRE